MITGCNQEVTTPRISDADPNLGAILGSISAIESDSYFLHEVDVIFVTDYNAHAGIEGTDSDYVHNLYISVTRVGDPPDFKLYKAGPFYLPSFKGFKPKSGTDTLNEVYSFEIEYQKGNERITSVITFNFEFARIE